MKEEKKLIKWNLKKKKSWRRYLLSYKSTKPNKIQKKKKKSIKIDFSKYLLMACAEEGIINSHTGINVVILGDHLLY